jgi:hypothetical protein
VISAATQARDDERRWYLITTEFTLCAIRNPAAARALVVHEDDSVRPSRNSLATCAPKWASNRPQTWMTWHAWSSP